MGEGALPQQVEHHTASGPIGAGASGKKERTDTQGDKWGEKNTDPEKQKQKCKKGVLGVGAGEWEKGHRPEEP